MSLDSKEDFNQQQRETLFRIYEATKDALRKQAFGLIGKGNSDAVHDLVQDTYIALQPRIDENGILRDRRGREVSDCLAYAKTTLKNLFIAWNKDGQRFLPLPVSDEKSADHDAVLLSKLHRQVVRTFFANDFSRSPTNFTLGNLLTKLPPEIRGIFIQRVLEERSWEDISKETGRPISYCKYAVKAAKATLRYVWKCELDRDA
jgi:DNA-directed RNA polymerase specialized sigma24 family protein